MEKETIIKSSELNAKEFFDIIKERKNSVDHEKLKQYYENCLSLIKKFEITGQKESLEKLKFHITCMEKEMKLLDLGINTYINFSDIKKFLEKTKDKDVLFVEMSDFPREIPDEVIPYIEKTKNIFNKFYILFTDYTDETREEITKKIKKEKDPILFGAFVNNGKEFTKLERFYYLADWVDEYCDLTLEKIMSLGVKTHEFSERSLEEIKEDINSFQKTNETTENNTTVLTSWYTENSDFVSIDSDSSPVNVIKGIPQYEKVEKKKSFLGKVKTWLMK